MPGVSAVVAGLYVAGGIAILFALRESLLPPAGEWGIFGFFIVFQFLLFFFSVPIMTSGSDAKGYFSFDHLVPVAAILLLGPAPAAWAAGVAALAYMLASNLYREPWRQLIPRALGNGGMFFIFTLAAGLVYGALGGEVPLHQLGAADLARVCALILTLQVANEVLYVAMTWPAMSKKARHNPIQWPSVLTEIIISFIGLITVLAYVKLSLSVFVLYVAMIFDIAVLLKVMVASATSERQRAHELGAVNRVNQAVDSAANLDELIAVIFREARGLIDFAAFLVGLYEHGSDEMEVRFNYDQGKRWPPSRRKPGEGVLAWTIANQQSLLITDARTSTHPAIARRIITGKPAISIMAVPINFRGVVVGVLSMQDYRPRVFHKHHLQLLEGFAQQIAVAIVNTRLFAELQAHQRELEKRVARRTAELERTSASLAGAMEQKEALLERLERENRRDALTGLANRRHLDETLTQEHYRAQRFGHPLAVAIGDLDHFKQVNDQYGHACGDEVLKMVAELLAGEVRATDLVSRYGGEEFVILFPETTSANALIACEKLCARIATYHWDKFAPGLALTMSFGVAENSREGKSRTRLLAEADRALYRAKAEGRNCVRSGEG